MYINKRPNRKKLLNKISKIIKNSFNNYNKLN